MQKCGLTEDVCPALGKLKAAILLKQDEPAENPVNSEYRIEEPVMSVEKMNYYKEQKTHRKENLAKEKRRKQARRAAWTILGVVVAVGLCGAIGLTGYNTYKAREAAKPDYSASSLMIGDAAGVLSMEEEAEDLELDEAEAEEAGEANEAEAGEPVEEAAADAAEAEAVTEAAGAEAETEAATEAAETEAATEAAETEAATEAAETEAAKE